MVDSINASSGSLNIQEILGNTVRRKEDQAQETMPLPIDQMSLSSIAQVVEAAKEAGASQDELEEFRVKIMEAVQNGTFDAETLAKEAPTAMKDAAEELGIDLTSALEGMASDIQTRGAYPPPPPAEEDDDDDDTTTQETLKKLVDAARASGASEEELEAFRVKIKEAIENGTFDTEALALQAPDALKAAAEKEGVELSSALLAMTE